MKTKLIPFFALILLACSSSSLSAANAIIDVSGSLAYGDVTTGTVFTASMTISNSGTATLNVSGIVYPSGFSGAWTGAIPPNGSQTVTVSFAPQAVQAYGGTITVQSDATSGNGTLACSGNGIPAANAIIDVSGNLAYGDVTTGTVFTASMTISNTGTATLNVSGIVYPSGFSGAWTGAIPPNGSQTVTVSFAPQAVQAYGGTITVQSDATSGNGTLACSGNGIPAATAAPPSLGFAPAGDQALLTWPADATNYILQSATDLASANWVTVSNATPGTNLPVAYDLPARFFRLYQAPIIPAGMALIPAGEFTIGNVMGESDIGDAYPTNVNVSAFYMDVTLVRYDHWQALYNWATSQGYSFYSTGVGKAPNHPVVGISWYDAVNWCNARSQQEGLTPVYYFDPSFTLVYTNASVHSDPYPNWAANGYRLPTEAEWEKAARGGLSGHRFPWGDTIDETLANYFGFYHANYPYDFGPFGYNATFSDGVSPYTSPVDYFAPNGYGLYDMAGNVKQWCWDWYGTPPYDSGSAYLGGTDPHGSTSNQSQKVLRGGDWDELAIYARCAARFQNNPTQAQIIMGFRCVRGL